MAVLIETLWNVKVYLLFQMEIKCRVLIETLWNVKIWKQAHDIGLSNRINRNIVECKVYLRSILPVTAIGINRNIVECKE